MAKVLSNGVVAEVEVSPVISGVTPIALPISGQVTVATAGTAVQGPNIELSNGVYIGALGANTGYMYIWHATGDGRGGYQLAAGKSVPVQVQNLNQLWFDASVNGEKICWLKA